MILSPNCNLPFCFIFYNTLDFDISQLLIKINNIHNTLFVSQLLILINNCKTLKRYCVFFWINKMFHQEGSVKMIKMNRTFNSFGKRVKFIHWCPPTYLRKCTIFFVYNLLHNKFPLKFFHFLQLCTVIFLHRDKFGSNFTQNLFLKYFKKRLSTKYEH